MDRLSAVLVICIVVMMGICAALIYRMNQGYNDMEYEVLVFNEDTSVSNNSEDDMWIRVRVNGNQSEDLIDSMEGYIDNKAWRDGGDGWHYYRTCLGSEKQSKPFVDEEWFLIEKDIIKAETMKLQVEGVKQ